MKENLNKFIDFTQVRTIITKEKSDFEEWKKCINIPFMLLNQNDIHSCIYIVVKKEKNYGYAIGGTPANIYTRLLEKISDADQIFITNINKEKIKEQWLITRE